MTQTPQQITIDSTRDFSAYAAKAKARHAQRLPALAQIDAEKYLCQLTIKASELSAAQGRLQVEQEMNTAVMHQTVGLIELSKKQYGDITRIRANKHRHADDLIAANQLMATLQAKLVETHNTGPHAQPPGCQGPTSYPRSDPAKQDAYGTVQELWKDLDSPDGCNNKTINAEA